MRHEVTICMTNDYLRLNYSYWFRFKLDILKINNIIYFLVSFTQENWTGQTWNIFIWEDVVVIRVMLKLKHILKTICTAIYIVKISFSLTLNDLGVCKITQWVDLILFLMTACIFFMHANQSSH